MLPSKKERDSIRLRQLEGKSEKLGDCYSISWAPINASERQWMSSFPTRSRDVVRDVQQSILCFYYSDTAPFEFHVMHGTQKPSWYTNGDSALYRILDSMFTYDHTPSIGEGVYVGNLTCRPATVRIDATMAVGSEKVEYVPPGLRRLEGQVKVWNSEYYHVKWVPQGVAELDWMKCFPEYMQDYVMETQNNILTWFKVDGSPFEFHTIYQGEELSWYTNGDSDLYRILHPREFTYDHVPITSGSSPEGVYVGTLQGRIGIKNTS